MKAFAALVVGLSVVFSVGCSSATSADGLEDSTGQSEEALTASSLKEAIENSVQPLWVDPCGSNRALAKRNIPRALRTTFADELDRLEAQIEADDLDPTSIDDSSTYGIYKRGRIIGYAVRVSVATGSYVAGYVTGYDKRGNVVSNQTDFGQDDGDFEEPAACE